MSIWITQKTVITVTTVHTQASIDYRHYTLYYSPASVVWTPSCESPTTRRNCTETRRHTNPHADTQIYTNFNGIYGKSLYTLPSHPVREHYYMYKGQFFISMNQYASLGVRYKHYIVLHTCHYTL